MLHTFTPLGDPFKHPSHRISSYQFLTQTHSNDKDHTNKYKNIFVSKKQYEYETNEYPNISHTMFQRAFSMLWVKCQGSNFTKLYVLRYIQGCDHNKDSGELNLEQNMWKLLCQDCSNRLGPLKKNISLCIFSSS